jgi:hypothetical protein
MSAADQFGPDDGHIFRSFDPNPNRISPDFDNSNHRLAVDDQALTLFTSEYQHAPSVVTRRSNCGRRVACVIPRSNGIQSGGQGRSIASGRAVSKWI